MAKVSKFYPLYAINVWHADRQTFPFLQKCHYHVNKTKKKKKLKYVFRSVCDEVWLEIPTFAYIYICVTDSSAIISTAKCGTPKLQAHCSVQFSMLRHAYMLYVYYQRKRRGKQTPCFCLKGNKALSLAMGPQGPQCVVRVTWL